MRQLDSRKRDRSILERLEAHHRCTPSLDRPMVLLDDVVEVLAGSHFHVAPDWMLTPQSPQRALTRHVTVKGNVARTARMRSECLAEERLCRGDAAVGSQQEVDRLAPLVDGAVQVVPTTADRDIGLVHAPRSADGSSETAVSCLASTKEPFVASGRRPSLCENGRDPNRLARSMSMGQPHEAIHRR
jgi:hypothetical protein